MGSITFIEASLADFPADTVSVTTVFARPMGSSANAYPAMMSRPLTTGMSVDAAVQ